ncbi:hypothetical protein V144x_52260 [Gimesia aquarii]|uniref:Uncharacterized protein n=1 Tax=Gimesia aquarii TaxID=2527964 RepID=A0A517W385_9PLAN|nr:hypothetical protein V144x_52260 [Gimesia aquarii]
MAVVQEKAALPVIAGLKICLLVHAMIAANLNDAASAPFRLVESHLFSDLLCQVVLKPDLLDQFKL